MCLEVLLKTINSKWECVNVALKLSRQHRDMSRLEGQDNMTNSPG